MIRIENTVVSGMEAAIRGMRNAKNSWDKADSKSGICTHEELDTMTALQAADYTDALYAINPELTDGELDVIYENYKSTLYENAIMDEDEHYCSYFILGENDKKLAATLAKAGPDHGKFLRQIQVSVDITAPLFW